MLKIYLKLIEKYRPSAGWTLTELLLAASLTLVVVTAAGFGLLTILRENKAANATGQMQYDLNRAVEFISEEVRNATRISTSLTNLATDAPSFSQSSSKIPILSLKIPGIPEQVIYYLEASQDPWRKPYVIRRWGPPFNLDGTYSSKVEPKNWQGDALIDTVLGTLSDANQKKCRNTDWATTYATSVPETSRWYRIPSADTDIKGFFICVRGDGQLVELHAQATTSNELDYLTSKPVVSTDAYGQSYKQESRFASKLNYEVVTNVFARANQDGAAGLTFPDFGVYNKAIRTEEDGHATVTLLTQDCDSKTTTPPEKPIIYGDSQSQSRTNSLSTPINLSKGKPFNFEYISGCGTDHNAVTDIPGDDVNRYITAGKQISNTTYTAFPQAVRTYLEDNKYVVNENGLYIGNSAKLQPNQVLYYIDTADVGGSTYSLLMVTLAP